LKRVKTTVFTLKCKACGAEFAKSLLLPDEIGKVANKTHNWKCKCGAKASKLEVVRII
jgi:hypothetical protein